MPLSMCVAMSQGYIGYDLQNMIGEELDRRGLGIHCATVLTQVAVDPADPAFQHPTKPIGAFMTEEEAKKLAADVKRKDVRAEVDADIAEGQRIGVQGTPYFLINNLVARGALSSDLFKEAINMALQAAPSGQK